MTQTNLEIAGSTRFFSSLLEQRDANSTISRDDLPARGGARKGWSSETYTDEQNQAGDRAVEHAGGSKPLSSVFREDEQLRIREIASADVDPTCREHGKRFCKQCFSAAEIEEMKVELAEAKKLAKRDAEGEEMPEDFDAELRGVKEGHGRANKKETRKIIGEFEKLDPEIEED